MYSFFPPCFVFLTLVLHSPFIARLLRLTLPPLTLPSVRFCKIIEKNMLVSEPCSWPRISNSLGIPYVKGVSFVLVGRLLVSSCIVSEWGRATRKTKPWNFLTHLLLSMEGRKLHMEVMIDHAYVMKLP